MYEWQGTDRGYAPIVLMGHIDVVPAGSDSGTRWTRPPFGGAISDGFVYGRGALDDKGAVIAILDAVEQLLQEGLSPSRTIYLAFGADEEVGGEHGAREIVRLLQARGIGEPALVLDEGGALIAGQVPGVAGPAAMIGIAEKGYLTLELLAKGPSGHSSTPLVPTQIGRLSAAIARLEAHPFPGRLVARVKRTIADPAIAVQPLPVGFATGPSPVSDVSGPAFAALASAARQTLGGTSPLIVPFLTGPTDSRYWCKVNARNVFRFTPFLYERDWMSRAHGTDERIATRTLADGVRSRSDRSVAGPSSDALRTDPLTMHERSP